MSTASFDDIAVPELPRLLRYACALTGDPDLADDIVQNVMVRAYDCWSRISSTDVPQAYLTRMVTNEVLSLRRRRRPATVPLDLAAVDSRHHARPADTDDATELRRLLAALPARQRAALVLRYYLDYSDIDAAAILGCAPGTLRSLCSRGIAALRPTTVRPDGDSPHASPSEKVSR